MRHDHKFTLEVVFKQDEVGFDLHIFRNGKMVELPDGEAIDMCYDISSAVLSRLRHSEPENAEPN